MERKAFAEGPGFQDQTNEPIDIAGQQADEGLVHEPNPDEQDPRITQDDTGVEEETIDEDEDEYDEGDDEFEEGLLGEDDEN